MKRHVRLHVITHIITTIQCTHNVHNVRDIRESDDTIPKYWGEGVHKEDILCMAHLEPDLLVTSSYDGDVVVWDVEIEQPLAVLNDCNSGSCHQYNKLHRKLMAIKKKQMEADAQKGKRGACILLLI